MTATNTSTRGAAALGPAAGPAVESFAPTFSRTLPTLLLTIGLGLLLPPGSEQSG